jgi:hypothetical protein
MNGLAKCNFWYANCFFYAIRDHINIKNNKEQPGLSIVILSTVLTIYVKTTAIWPISVNNVTLPIWIK